MLYLLDTGNLEAIERAFDFYPVSGVTTNPTLIAREQRNFLDILRDIRAVIGDDAMLHVQTLGADAEKIVAEAKYLEKTLAGNLYIKVPAVPEGLKAMKLLKRAGIRVTATAIFTSQQALLCMMAGASFVAPYVNRLDNICGQGAQVVGEIVELIDRYGLEAKVLGASFKSVQQVHEVARRGGQAVTISPDMLDALLAHPLTDLSVKQFRHDWEAVYGQAKLTYEVR